MDKHVVVRYMYSMLLVSTFIVKTVIMLSVVFYSMISNVNKFCTVPVLKSVYIQVLQIM